ncbi:MAG TPA: hypothetical protein VGJ21_21475 [Terracidiphilus sp.]
MRRFVSIALLVLCWLGPASALLPAGDESQLPACCRRHGEHHCTAAMAGATEHLGTGHRVTAPAHCPFYRVSSPARTGAFVLAASPVLEQATESAMPVRATRLTLLRHARASADRGPPAAL